MGMNLSTQVQIPNKAVCISMPMAKVWIWLFSPQPPNYVQTGLPWYDKLKGKL